MMGFGILYTFRAEFSSLFDLNEFLFRIIELKLDIDFKNGFQSILINLIFFDRGDFSFALPGLLKTTLGRYSYNELIIDSEEVESMDFYNESNKSVLWTFFGGEIHTEALQVYASKNSALFISFFKELLIEDHVSEVRLIVLNGFKPVRDTTRESSHSI